MRCTSSSNVEGNLKPGTHNIDVLRGNLPRPARCQARRRSARSEIIHEVEPVKRNIYGGAGRLYELPG